MKHLYIIILLLFTTSTLYSQKPKKLFRSDSILELTITLPLKEVVLKRQDPIEHNSRLTYTADDGTVFNHVIKVKMRGKTRANKQICSFPPLQLRFNKKDVERANLIRINWYAELDRLFDESDFLVLPTAQVFPFPNNIHWPKQINGQEMDTYHRWMEVVILGSLGGIPVVNVPAGFDSQGRPMGIQVMGKFGDDKRVLEFALAYEQITDHLKARPKLIAVDN